MQGSCYWVNSYFGRECPRLGLQKTPFVICHLPPSIAAGTYTQTIYSPGGYLLQGRILAGQFYYTTDNCQISVAGVSAMRAWSYFAPHFPALLLQPSALAGTQTMWGGVWCGTFAAAPGTIYSGHAVTMSMTYTGPSSGTYADPGSGCNYGVTTIACSAGVYCPAGALQTTCPAGNYCPAASAAPTQCPAGE